MSMRGAKVRIAPPDAVITTSAAMSPDSARHSAAGVPRPEPSAGARSLSPTARAIGQASGMASAGRTATTKTTPNPGPLGEPGRDRDKHELRHGTG